MFSTGAATTRADDADSAQGIEFFEKRIRPLLAERCYKCHGPKKQESELRLDRHSGILAGGQSGAAIVPGRAKSSLLIAAVEYQNPDLQMPPKKKLSASEIADLKRWIDMGAPYPGAKSGPSQKPADANAAKHWAFQTLTDQAPPKVKNQNWAHNEIDRFILAALEEAELSPSPPADPRTFVRRATFDLTGLPPTPEEIAQFERDSIRDPRSAFRNLMNRLLASPHYGEKWGRHWLDVARYADSNGLDENVAHGNAWRYRDYVIAAFNNDKSYDQFVAEQIAGDLLISDLGLRNAEFGDRQSEMRIATGFLSLGPKVLAEVDERKMEMDIVDEQVDVVGKAFLGLTLGCARCHDHKFDPISQEDYYALAGVFKSTHTMDTFKKVAKWHEIALPSEQYEKDKQLHDRQLATAKKAIDEFVSKANSQLRKQLGAGAQFPPNPEESYPNATRDELKRLRDELAVFEKQKPVPPSAMGVIEGATTDAAIHIRGSHLTLGETVPRRVPQILAAANDPKLGDKQSGRLELAQWMTAPDSAVSALTARVMVNRIWHWHFGRGLVATTDNFGLLGERPTNAALLDWLAAQFINSGWSIKKMHRLIMHSSTYQLSSRFDERAARIDPENRLLWRMNIQRLQAEEFRDAILTVTGKLDPSMGGSILNVENRGYIFDHTSKDNTTYTTHRRSVYLPVIRNHLCDAFTLFDYTDASVPNGSRAASVVPAQALYILNSEFVTQAAQTLAHRIASSNQTDEARVWRLYETCYARPPRESETTRLLDFLRDSNWQAVCHAVLSSNEFVYLK